MNAIVLGKVTQKGLILFCLFFLLLLIGGCGSSGGDEPNCSGPGCKDNPGSDIDFSGDWNIHEELEGCGATETLEKDYHIVIKQNGDSATLEVAEQNYIDCTISDDQLRCEGDLSFVNGGRIDYSKYNLWYKGEDNLEGEGSWTLYDPDNNSCTGTSVFSATSGPASDDSSNFNGTYTIFEEQDEGIYGYGQYNYEVRIEQTGTQATLSKGNEHLTCNVVGEDLVCDGTFSYEEIEGGSLNCAYDSYTLHHDGNTGLTGEASWSATYQGDSEYGRSNLSTTRPEEGSIRIYNRTDSTLRLLNFRPCGSSDWGENQFNSDDTMEPDNVWTFWNILQDCYDVRACEDVNGTTGCATGEDFNVNGGETFWISIDPDSSLRLYQNGIDPEPFTGTMVREFKSSNR